MYMTPLLTKVPPVTRRRSLLSLLVLLGLAAAPASGETTTPAPPTATIDLLDAELSQWEVWMGVPHATVTGLPAGTYQSDNVHAGDAMGLDNDVKGVFTVIDEGDGADGLELHITGEIYGGLTTKASFADYHLTMQFRWGERKWEPRLDAKRDSGILYHCYGDHGAFWRVWKSCLEFQVQETDLGDFIPLAGPKARVRGVLHDGKRLRYDPASDTVHPATGYTDCTLEPDAPHGEWNTLDLYVVGNNAVHVVNGEVVMVVQDAVDGDGRPLTEGQIQLQSEAAECFYKGLRLTPLSAFPSRFGGLIRD